MRQVKTFSAMIIAILALSAIASATASAEPPEFLPGAAGTQFTGKSGAGKLEVKGEAPVSCTADSVKGELTGTTKNLGKATVEFTGCTAFGIFGAHTLGDKEGVIKIVEADLHLCFIKKAAPLEVGVLTEIAKTKPAHIEVAGKLLVVTGDQVGKITPLNTSTKLFTITYTQKGGVPSPEGCEGKKEHYVTEINESKKPIESGEETTEETTFTTIAQTLDG